MADATPSSDEALLSRFAAGDREALGALARRYERPLLGLAKGLLGGSDDMAREAVQVMWIKVIRHARSFRAGSAVRTWLYRIIINTCHDMRRHQARHVRPGVIPNDHPSADQRPEVEDADADADAVTALRTAMAQLDPAAREVLLLCHHRGLTNEQAAEVLRLPVGTLKTRLRAARQELRSRLKPEVCCDA